MSAFHFAVKLAVLGVCAATPMALHAQTPAYPAKPIRIICPAAPGGISDLLSRIAAQRLTPLYGQQVIVENRPGSGGHLAGDLVAKMRLRGRFGRPPSPAEHQ